MAQQTAVQWLVEQSKKQEWFTYERENFINQAKQMEKEQIMNAFDMGCQDENMIGEEYYNETFGK